MLLSSMTAAVELRKLVDRGSPPPPAPLLLPPPPAALLLLLGFAAAAAVAPGALAPLRRRLVSGISCISFCMHSHSPSSAVTARLVPCSAHLHGRRQAGVVCQVSTGPGTWRRASPAGTNSRRAYCSAAPHAPGNVLGEAAEAGSEQEVQEEDGPRKIEALFGPLHLHGAPGAQACGHA